MISVEVLKFCEDNAVSIKKFLQDNFSIESYVPKYNKNNRKWRIKHSEIAVLHNVISVPLKFAYRYKHLVLTGKLVIVRDEFGKYNVYINPRIIQELSESIALQEKLAYLDEHPEEFDDAIRMVEVRRQLTEKIQDIEESLRIIKHFNGEESLEYMMGLMNVVAKDNMSRSRKRLENNQ